MLAIGVQTWGTDVAALRSYWRAADELGYAAITYGDGLGTFTHDGWTMLGALAEVTRQARIGPAVTYAFGPSSHHPSWLAKRAVTVDHLSAGRLDLRLAVGAADPGTAEAWAAHGIRYPPPRERIETLEETIRVMRGLWRVDRSLEHQGPRYELRGARLGAAPVQPGGPPVWIAAMGPRALALTARCADGWEASYLTAGDFGARWERLRALLLAGGRDAGACRRSVELDAVVSADPTALPALLDRFCAERRIDGRHPLVETVLAGDGRALAARVAAYAAAGATDLMLGFADFPATGMLERLAAAIPLGRR